MAELIPDKLPSSSTAGEKRVFATLGRLPDDCLVYYEPVVRRRYPDLIAILPEIGVLVIEVKDWRLAELRTVKPDTVTIDRRGTPLVVPHPRQQARGYMLRLMDACRRHPQAGMLMQHDGRHAGAFAFPFSHIAVLSNINRSQIEREACEIAELFPTGTTITRDELAAWEGVEPSALLARLKACFDPWWPFPKLTEQQINVLRSIIHPEVIVRARSTDLAVLDLRQERHARALGDGHRIVYGVAGSGKTLLLIARAKLIAEDPHKRVLVLCYNRLLAQHLTEALSGYDNVKVSTFHRWGVRCGVDFRKEEEVAFGERVLARLRNDAAIRGQYDAVLIDEAQDWPRSWFQCAKLSLKEPETGDLLIVGDGSQSLYRRRDFTWADVGIHATGRVINRKFDLDRNYRNTAEILRIARPFSLSSGRGLQEGLTLSLAPDTAARSGPEPSLIRLRDALSELEYAAALIETWLRGGVEIGGRHQYVRPGDIAVLYPRRRPDADLNVLCDRLNHFTRSVQPASDKRTSSLRDKAVQILPIHSARGLQFRVVILLWTDLLPSPFQYRDDHIDRGLLYVALTRAEDLLVMLHSGSSSYVEELHKALGTRRL